MNNEQAEVINEVQQVLRTLVMSLGALNAKAMPTVAHALRAAVAEGVLSPTASAMVSDLASGIEHLTGGGASRGH